MSACQTPNAVYSSQAHLPRRVRPSCLPAHRTSLPTTTPSRVAKRYAILAKNSEPRLQLSAGGPWRGRGTCGTNCESYCTLIKKACPDQGALLTDCENQLRRPFRTVGTLDVVANHEGDTLELPPSCTSAPRRSKPATHCSHTGVFPTAFCVDDPTARARLQQFSAGSR